jgi:hypothetical protein
MTKDVKVYLTAIRWSSGCIREGHKTYYDYETTEKGICQAGRRGLLVGGFATKQLNSRRKGYEHQGFANA